MPKHKVVLFDFDGVIMDTETIYTDFWNDQGKNLLDIDDFGELVKGSTDRVIYRKYFSENPEFIPVLDQAIADLEYGMPMNYIAGVKELIEELRSKGMRIGMATSSDTKKMEMVFSKRPELKGLLDKYITVDEVKQPKPNPEGYIKLIEYFGVRPQDALVFEDSTVGLTAARDSGGIVVGVASTNPREVIAPYCHHVIDDFSKLDHASILKLYDI